MNLPMSWDEWAEHDGVALAAIQGLNDKLERENAQLRERLARIEALLMDARFGKR
mgnify:CR=1 FL=1